MCVCVCVYILFVDLCIRPSYMRLSQYYYIYSYIAQDITINNC